MITFRGILLRVGAAVAVIVLLASCATINRLDHYVIENASLRTEMRVPPPPTLNIGYSTRLGGPDRHGAQGRHDHHQGLRGGEGGAHHA
jgi:hypothetical protein